MKAQDQIPLDHPGIILKEEFLQAYNLSAYRVAKATGLTQQALGQILKGKRSITALVSLRLDRYFALSSGYFFRLQEEYDLRLAQRELGNRLEEEIQPLAEIKSA